MDIETLAWIKALSNNKAIYQDVLDKSIRALANSDLIYPLVDEEGHYITDEDGDILLADNGGPLKIMKVYASIEEMEDDYDTEDVKIGQLVVISTEDVEEEDNAKMFVKGRLDWEFITDLSGIQGPPGPAGEGFEHINQDGDMTPDDLYDYETGLYFLDNSIFFPIEESLEGTIEIKDLIYLIKDRTNIIFEVYSNLGKIHYNGDWWDFSPFLEVDGSLSVEGKAADAKAVGDAIAAAIGNAIGGEY